MKHPSPAQIFLKIALISVFLLGIFQSISFFWGENPSQDISQNISNTENNEQYQSAYAANFGNVGVALSTRIGMQYQSLNSNLQSGGFYKEIASVGATAGERRILRGDMIAQNMLIIQEYLNLSKTDVKSMLDTSSNRRATLEGFISQLELRYKNSAISQQSLEKQKALILIEIEKNQVSIEATKKSMETNFALSQASATLWDIDTYFILRSDYTESFTDIVFINQFIKQHEFLNSYNKTILDTLINNKEAIINKTYVVIPDSGDEYLRPLELLFDEADIKAKVLQD